MRREREAVSVEGWEIGLGLGDMGPMGDDVSSRSGIRTVFIPYSYWRRCRAGCGRHI